MLYRFKSQAAADVIMFEANAHQILKIIGKPASSPGILSVPQIPAAISAIRLAITQAEALPAAPSSAAASAQAADPENSKTSPSAISLRQRATPFLTLLERSAALHKDVVWGV